MLSFVTPTHNVKHLKAAYESLQNQTRQEWDWTVVVNGAAKTTDVQAIVGTDPRVRIFRLPANLENKGIGAIKRYAFGEGIGEYLCEYDHDDMLASTTVEAIEAAPKSDFIYSNTADFFPSGAGHYFPQWKENGWRYRDAVVDSRWYLESLSFEPSAASLSLIFYSPNHIRCWNREFYHRIGGHNSTFTLADDHELCIRTYLEGTIHHIDKPLYLYRIADNTWNQNVDKIRDLTWALYCKYLGALILREGEISGLPCFDLGAAHNPAPGWTTVDLHNADVTADLTQRWPWADNSVLAFRAQDFIEHLPDKMHTMREMHRCLVPGGWALIDVPSTDGRGAFCDPTHVSYWNEISFWYFTRPEKAKFILNTDCRWMESRLFTFFPSKWNEETKVPYVKAELRAFKGDMVGHPGYCQWR